MFGKREKNKQVKKKDEKYKMFSILFNFLTFTW